MPDQIVLALDIGGSSVKSALVANGQHIVGKVRVDEVQSGASANQILIQFSRIISNYLGTAKEVNRIAFAFPGPFNYAQGISRIQNQAKYDALYGLNIGAELKEILGSPMLEMRFRNDAEAAILGEALYGAGVPYSRLIGLTLGTGLGSAFVANRKLIKQGAKIPPHGWLYACMFESQRADDIFSTRGLLARLREHGIHAADVALAMHHADDPALVKAFISFGADLGGFLKPFVLNFGADAVLVTGGLAVAWRYFAPGLRGALPVPSLRGTLGRRAALFGAAALYL